jgi:capsid protein
MAPIFYAIGMHDDIEFAKLVQAQIVSCFALIRETPEEGIGLEPAQTGSQTSETRADGTTRTLSGLSPGMEIIGAPGEKLSGFSPNVPNAEFFQHAQLILGFIAINLGIPPMVMLLDPSRSNFSSWRGAMDAAKPGFDSLLQTMVKTFYKPVYQWKVRQWLSQYPDLARAAQRDGINVFGHRWIAPKTPYIEPNKDAQAELTIMNGLLNSRREVLASRGLDVDDIDRMTIRDNKALIIAAAMAAKEVKEACDVEVSWRDILQPNEVKRSQAVESAEDGQSGQGGQNER